MKMDGKVGNVKLKAKDRLIFDLRLGTLQIVRKTRKAQIQLTFKRGDNKLLLNGAQPVTRNLVVTIVTLIGEICNLLFTEIDFKKDDYIVFDLSSR